VDGTWTYSYARIGQVDARRFRLDHPAIANQDEASFTTRRKSQRRRSSMADDRVHDQQHERVHEVGNTTYTYDAGWHMTSATDATRARRHYTFDAQTNVHSINGPSGSWSWTNTECQFWLERCGNL